jgi:hypothetical protein
MTTMKRKLTLLWLPLLLAISGTVLGADWVPVGSQGTVPQVSPAGIKVGAGLTYGSGSTITVTQGDTVNLSATSIDKDTKKVTNPDCTVTETGENDSCDIIWGSNGGGLPAPLRRASGATIVFTAPALAEGENSRTIAITATPDDNTTAAPGNRPAGDTGNRNDDPGTAVTLNIKVIRSCPTDAALGANCSPPFAWLFANLGGVKTAGLKTVQTVVSGGTPPNPPGNWNGIFIKETVVLHPTNPGTGVDGDFTVAGYRAASCTATVQGFIVGTSQGAFGPCPRTATDNAFWDDHGSFNSNPVLVQGRPDKTVNCQQKYFCGATQLHTPGANSAFIITRSFHESTYDPDGAGPLPAYRVNEVTVTKGND